MTLLIFGVSRCNLPNVTGDCTASHSEGATRKEPEGLLSAVFSDGGCVCGCVCGCVGVCVCACVCVCIHPRSSLSLVMQAVCVSESESETEKRETRRDFKQLTPEP